MFRALLPHLDVWFKIGIDLGLDTLTLSRISVGHKDSTDIALMMVVRSWFHSNPSPNWSSVNTVLQNVGNKGNRQTTRSMHGIHSALFISTFVANFKNNYFNPLASGLS